MKKVFISYARDDKEAALRLFDELKKVGGEPWIDVHELLPGQNWKSEINRAISECSHFIAILSENSVTKRGYVQKELKVALDIMGEIPPNEIFVIPVRLDNSTPQHEELLSLHWVDLFPSWSDGVNKITKSLGLSIKVSKYENTEINKPNSKRTSEVESLLKRLKSGKVEELYACFGSQDVENGTKGVIELHFGEKLSFVRMTKKDSDWEFFWKGCYIWHVRWDAKHGVVAYRRDAVSPK